MMETTYVWHIYASNFPDLPNGKLSILADSPDEAIAMARRYVVNADIGMIKRGGEVHILPGSIYGSGD